VGDVVLLREGDDRSAHGSRDVLVDRVLLLRLHRRDHAKYLYALLRIPTDAEGWLARGYALGTASHGIGAARALQVYCDLIADSVLDGLAAGQAASGVDLGAAIAPVEPTLQRELTPDMPEAEAVAEVAAD
jgi:hypothetical protein